MKELAFDAALHTMNDFQKVFELATASDKTVGTSRYTQTAQFLGARRAIASRATATKAKKKKAKPPATGG